MITLYKMNSRFYGVYFTNNMIDVKIRTFKINL